MASKRLENIKITLFNTLSCLQVSNDHEEELGSAASFLIREWVEKLLGVKFDSLRDLALYLVSISHQPYFIVTVTES